MNELSNTPVKIDVKVHITKHQVGEN